MRKERDCKSDCKNYEEESHLYERETSSIFHLNNENVMEKNAIGFQASLQISNRNSPSRYPFPAANDIWADIRSTEFIFNLCFVSLLVPLCQSISAFRPMGESSLSSENEFLSKPHLLSAISSALIYTLVALTVSLNFIFSEFASTGFQRRGMSS